MTVDILIDVDGVINALTRKKLPEWGWAPDSIRRQYIADFPITWSAEFVAALNDLSAYFEDIEVFWLTTWLDLAPRELAPAIGLHEGKSWKVIGRDEWQIDNPFSPGKPGLPKNQNSWWKLDAAQRHFVERQNRFVWIDDDLDDSDARAWGSSLLEAKSDTCLFVQPDSRVGVTKSLFSQIIDWIEQ